MKNTILSKTLFCFLILAALGLCGCDDDDDDDEIVELERAQFISQYSVDETCPSGNFSYDIYVTISPSLSDNEIVIGNFGSFGSGINAAVDGNAVSIPNQVIVLETDDGDLSINIIGSGSISGNVLTIDYTYSTTDFEESCTKICTKV